MVSERETSREFQTAAVHPRGPFLIRDGIWIRARPNKCWMLLAAHEIQLTIARVDGTL